MKTAISIVYGLLGLNLLVLIHEFGHFLLARACGVIVESFSIGMGPILLHKKIKGTDYRLSLIPLGGYCGLKGQKDFEIAINEKKESIKSEKGSFYAIHPVKRILIAFAGPGFNFIFAIFAYMIIAMTGYSYYTSGNKIILANEIYPEMTSLAAEKGLKTGDKIIAINDKPTPYFNDIYENIAVNAKKQIKLTVERNDNLKSNSNENQIFDVEITPSLNKETGAGVIGIVSWTDPIIDEIEPGSSAEIAGLMQGDFILQINGKDIANTAEYKKNIYGQEKFDLTVLRNGKSVIIENVVPTEKNGNSVIGIIFHAEQVESKKFSFFPAIKQGIKEAGMNTALTIKSIALLFKGINITKAVSGPLRITVMLGDSAKEGFSEGFSAGLVNILTFLSIISISLFIMNLLPIPILDGGLILVSLIEAICNKKISPKFQYYIQFVGLAIILILFSFALFGDISYLINKIKGI
ncbi:MAG: RIP metalloprotease RseP [Treponemataceae bacterium]